jgi:hypothetical protein
MAEYDNTNSGALFKNDKQGNETWADYKGSLNVGGTEYWVSAWIKEAKSGNGKFMSLSIKPKDAKPAAKPTRSRDPEDDGDRPF